VLVDAGVLYFVSCTVNPILYNVLSRRFRQAFVETICRRQESTRPDWMSDDTPRRGRGRGRRSTTVVMLPSRRRQQQPRQQQQPMTVIAADKTAIQRQTSELET